MSIRRLEKEPETWRSRAGHPANFRNIVRFAFVSGTGLALDVLLFLLLLSLGWTSLWANAASATCAVAFVFFASVHRIFSYAGAFLLGLFLAYLAYQAAAVAAASFAVAFLVAHGLAPALAKIAILPATFAANFLFMTWLTRYGRKRAPASDVKG